MSGSTLWKQWLGSPRRRSLAGLILALASMPLLLGIDACSTLKTPIGDPEKAWADPRISGVWLSAGSVDEPLAEFAGTIWVFEPFDATTWLVTLASFSKSNAPTVEATPQASAPVAASASTPEATAVVPSVAQVVSTLGDRRVRMDASSSTFKGWLTALGGRRFLVLQPTVDVSVQRGLRPEEWLVYAASLKDGTLILSGIDTKVEHLQDVTSRARAEGIIARHAADPTFTKVWFVLHPVPRASFDDAAKALQRVGGQ
jgi:hypothetical protein